MISISNVLFSLFVLKVHKSTPKFKTNPTLPNVPKQPRYLIRMLIKSIRITENKKFTNKGTTIGVFISQLNVKVIGDPK